MRTHDSNEPTTPQAEKFDEFTGGYDDIDHARAAKRLSADLRAMDATPREPDYRVQTSVASPRKHVRPVGTTKPTLRYCLHGVVVASWRESDGTKCVVQLTEQALRDMLAFCQTEQAAALARAVARATR